MMNAGRLLLTFLGGWVEVRLTLFWIPMFFSARAFLQGLVSGSLAGVACCFIYLRFLARP
jgi:hypothetical protein